MSSKHKNKPKKVNKQKKSATIASGGPTGLALVPQSLREMKDYFEERVSFLEKLAPAKRIPKAEMDEKKNSLLRDSHPLIQKLLKGGDHKIHGRGYHRNAPYRTKVSDRYNSASAVDTNLTAVIGLAFNNTTDGLAFAALFDECRCVGVEVRVLYSTHVASTTVPTTPLRPVHGCVAYDPSNVAAYGGIAPMLDAAYKIGPWNWQTGNGTGGPNPDGLALHMHVKVPATVLPPTSTIGVVGSNWTGANDTAALAGYLKPFADQAGALLSTYIYYYVCYEMEYAFRT